MSGRQRVQVGRAVEVNHGLDPRRDAVAGCAGRRGSGPTARTLRAGRFVADGAEQGREVPPRRGPQRGDAGRIHAELGGMSAAAQAAPPHGTSSKHSGQPGAPGRESR